MRKKQQFTPAAQINLLGHASRNHPNGKTYYIGEPNGLPGQGGADWGWTDKPSEAMALSPYWQRRFRADMRRCGYSINSPGEN